MAYCLVPVDVSGEQLDGWLAGTGTWNKGVCVGASVCVLFRQGPLMSSFICTQRALYMDLSSFGPV